MSGNGSGAASGAGASLSPRGLLFGIVVLALALRLAWAWSELETLLRYAVSDDAFYYFQIARNWVAGHGASLDGATVTNGFHPLWFGLLAGIHGLTAAGESALRLGLGLGALLGAGSVALLYRVVDRTTGAPAAALFAAAVYAVHPTAILESVNGLETALAVFTTAWAVERYVSLRAAARDGGMRDAALFGLAGGALLLARTDAVFLWAVLLLALAIGTRRLRPALLAGLVSSACVAPWLAWNQLEFGSVMQISAVALPEALRADFLAAHANEPGAPLARSLYLLQRAFLQQLPQLYAVPRGFAVWPLGLAALAGLVATLRAPRERAALARLLPALLGVGFTLGWHAGVRWWTREWYFAPAGWLAVVCLGVCAAALLHYARRLPPARRRPASAVLAGAGALCLLTLAAPPLTAHWRVASEHRVQQLEAARWLATRTAPDARIGAFNAGIYSYFSGRTVVNLDGVVNADAYAARRDGRLLDYALGADIDHVVDWRGTLPWLGCAQRDDVRCERVAVIGEPLPGFAGSPIWVLQLEAVAPQATH